MWILRKNNKFKTFEGWTTINKGGAIEGLDDVIRFTQREKLMNENDLPKGWEFVHFGCYKELEENDVSS